MPFFIVILYIFIYISFKCCTFFRERNEQLRWLHIDSEDFTTDMDNTRTQGSDEDQSDDDQAPRRSVNEALTEGARAARDGSAEPEQKIQNELLWRYFKKSEKEFDYSKGAKGVKIKYWRAVCQCETSDSTPEKKVLCHTTVKRKQGNTSTMRSHLRSHHTLAYSGLVEKESEAKRKLHAGRRKLQQVEAANQEYDDWSQGN